MTAAAVRTSCAAWLSRHQPLRYGLYPLGGDVAQLRVTATDGAVFQARGPESEMTDLASAVWMSIRDGAS